MLSGTRRPIPRRRIAVAVAALAFVLLGAVNARSDAREDAETLEAAARDARRLAELTAAHARLLQEAADAAAAALAAERAAVAAAASAAEARRHADDLARAAGRQPPPAPPAAVSPPPAPAPAPQAVSHADDNALFEATASTCLADLSAREMTGAIDSLPFDQYANYGFVSPFGGGEGATVTNAFRKFGLFLDPRFLSEDEDGNITLEGHPTEWLSVRAIFQRPALRLKVREAFTDDEESAALRKLDVSDDATVEAAFTFGRKPEVEVRREAEAQARSSLDRASISRDCVEAAGSRAIALRRLALRGYAAAIDDFYFQLVARHREADALVGQRETGLSLSAIWHAKKEGQDKPTMSFVVKGAYDERDPIRIDGMPALDEPSFRTLTATAKWTRKIFGTALKGPGGNDPGAEQSIDISYVRPNDDYANERIVATGLLSFPLRPGLAVPVTLTWSNRPELVTGDRVFGHVGISYTWDK